jgi:N-acyl-phosphatidylethanolamine-hydrolysing phospholipase D
MVKENKALPYLLTALACLCFATMCNAQSFVDYVDQGIPIDENGRYSNHDQHLSTSSTAVRLSFLMRRFSAAFRDYTNLPNQQANNGQWLRDNTEQASVTWVGHSTLLVQMQGINFLTDPIWSKIASPIPPLGPRRLVEPGLSIDDLPPIDFVVISHNHYDHFDLPTLRLLAQRDKNTHFYVPLDNGKLLNDQGINQVTEMDWGDTINVGNLIIHCLPSQHWSKRSLTDTNKAAWASWAVTGSNKRFYFAGDTGYFNGFKTIGEELGPFDLAAVPIGAYQPREMMQSSHMNPEEAVQSALDIQAQKAVAIHFGTFDLADEPIGEPAMRFKQAAKISALKLDKTWVLDIGETRLF